MPELMRDGLFARMVMEHRNDAKVVVFTSQAWWRLFDTRGPLVWELILEWTRRRLSWRQFILALGLHTWEEMKSLGFSRARSRLAEHFGLLTAEILQGLTVIAPALSVIDMAKLPNAAVGAPNATEDAPVDDEGGQAVLAPV
ncbi:hypothetical protein Tco_0408411 [Tanacetum coccineum]